MPRDQSRTGRAQSSLRAACPSEHKNEQETGQRTEESGNDLAVALTAAVKPEFPPSPVNMLKSMSNAMANVEMPLGDRKSKRPS